ncbi:MAG: hypothetical protein JNL33_08990 [Betaproteobacteria bacterium]|nr:hypothetical protein [Betaproteobacteria bacterium]
MSCEPLLGPVDLSRALHGARVDRNYEFTGGRDVLLVAITGWGRPDDRAQSRAAGFDLHLVQPVDLDVIESLLTGAPEDVPVRG